eukprot:5135424-Amphidinium_carterae.1
MPPMLDLAIARGFACFCDTMDKARPGNKVDENSTQTSCSVAASTVGPDSFPAKKSSPKPVNNPQTMRK